MGAAPRPAIRLEAVRCGYGRRQVIHDVSLTIMAGELVGLLGPNGSGKSTLLAAMSGALPLAGGSVEIAGRPLAAMRARERARAVACVPQRLEPVFDVRVLSLVLMGRYPYVSPLGGYSDEDVGEARSALRQAGLEGLEERPAGQLSGGEFQRAVIARALAQQADLLLLDEAASGLDIGRQLEIHDLLQARHVRGATVVSAIHNLNLAALYCDRLVFLRDGRIVEDGPTKAVFTEATISRIYDTQTVVFPHPVTGAPQCLLVPGPRRAAG